MDIIVGYLLVITTGSISFRTRSDDASDCFIDGHLVASNYGAHAFGGGTITTSSVTLQSGYHRLVYRFLQVGPGWQYELQWDTAGGSSWATISSSNMFFDPAEGISYAGGIILYSPLSQIVDYIEVELQHR